MSISGFARRLTALSRKETRQMLRDRSNLTVGLLLPAVLILLFGYGLSFDVRNARVAVIPEDGSAIAGEILAGLEGSPYIALEYSPSVREAEARMRAGEIDAILRVPADFSARFGQGEARLQLLLNGVDTTTAMSIEGFISGAIASTLRRQVDRAGNKSSSSGSAAAIQRSWFNEAGHSSWFLVPGLVALVLTLLGAFLTSLLVAREWERGTLEALFVTPVRPLEIVLAKLAPYLVVGAIDLVICLLAARFLFQLPIRGSLLAIFPASMLYLLVSLALGLFISAVTRNQFAASQMALLASFLPAMMLSGFVFDLRNVPVPVQWISQILPATHFMGLIKTLFLAGDFWPEILKASAILAAYAALLIALTRRQLRKQLE